MIQASKRKSKRKTKITDLNVDPLPISPRSYLTENTYQEAKKKGTTRRLADEPAIRRWHFWKLIDNEFPYDMLFSVHHMLIPLREVSEADLSAGEQKELKDILREISDDYNCYLVNFKSKQSIMNHYHVHLLTYKESRNEIAF